VLLCDEPTGALDSKTGIRVIEALLGVNSQLGTTTMIITHNASIQDVADRVLSFADGQIAGVRKNQNVRGCTRGQVGGRALGGSQKDRGSRYSALATILVLSFASFRTLSVPLTTPVMFPPHSRSRPADSDGCRS
jgi:ABC-type methionine transport system ATPase subunit